MFLCWTMKTPSFFYDNFYDKPNKVRTSYVRLCTLMKTVWINKVRKREVKSGYKILSLEIPVIVAGLIVAPIEHRSFWVLHQVSPVCAPKQSAHISQLHWLGRSDELRPDDGSHQLRHFAVYPQECIRQQLRYIAVALVDVRVGQPAACGQSPRRETLDALRRYKMKRGALELVLQLLF